MQLNPAEWIRQGRAFVDEVLVEFRRVVWPNRKESFGGTVGVLVIVFLIAALLGAVDFGLSRVLRLVLP